MQRLIPDIFPLMNNWWVDVEGSHRSDIHKNGKIYNGEAAGRNSSTVDFRALLHRHHFHLPPFAYFVASPTPQVIILNWTRHSWLSPIMIKIFVIEQKDHHRASSCRPPQSLSPWTVLWGQDKILSPIPSLIHPRWIANHWDLGQYFFHWRTIAARNK